MHSYSSNEDHKGSYQSLVAARTSWDSSLQNLHDFLCDGSTGQRPLQIVCLDLSKISGPKDPRRLDVNGLTAVLKNKPNDHDHVYYRLLIIEDLCPDVVEILGASLDVDPHFFASHIDTSQIDIATTRPSTARLPSVVRSQNFANFHYQRVIEIETPGPKKALYRDMNLQRKVKLLPEIKKAHLGHIRHCCSILNTVGSDGVGVGVMLIDPPINNCYLVRHAGDRKAEKIVLQTRLFQRGPQNVCPGPCFLGNTNKEVKPASTSLLDALICHWTNDRPPNFDQGSITMFILAYLPLRIIAADWMLYLELMYHSVKHYEYSADSVFAALEEMEKLNADIHALQQWVRRGLATSSKIRYVLRFLQHRKHEVDGNTDPGVLLMEDYEYLASDVGTHSRRLEALVSVATSLIQAIDCRRSLTATVNISKLTYLALSFIPLTYVTGLFSMNADIAPGGKLFWLYFAVAVPLCMVVFMIVSPSSVASGIMLACSWRSKKNPKIMV